MKKDKYNWSKPDENDIIHVPDELDSLVNKVGMQLNFIIYSGKNMSQTACDIVASAQEFFDNLHAKESEKNNTHTPEITIDFIAQKIANMAHMPYCWEDIKNRLVNGIALPFKLNESKNKITNNTEKIVLICDNCKNYWIAPIEKCDCGCKTFSETDTSNVELALNYNQVEPIPLKFKEGQEVYIKDNSVHPEIFSIGEKVKIKYTDITDSTYIIKKHTGHATIMREEELSDTPINSKKVRLILYGDNQVTKVCSPDKDINIIVSDFINEHEYKLLSDIEYWNNGSFDIRESDFGSQDEYEISIKGDNGIFTIKTRLFEIE